MSAVSVYFKYWQKIFAAHKVAQYPTDICFLATIDNAYIICHSWKRISGSNFWCAFCVLAIQRIYISRFMRSSRNSTGILSKSPTFLLRAIENSQWKVPILSEYCGIVFGVTHCKNYASILPEVWIFGSLTLSLTLSLSLYVVFSIYIGHSQADANTWKWF